MSKEAAIDYDKLLLLFVGDDPIRPVLSGPHTVGGNVYATDAHGLLIIPKELLSRQYHSDLKPPDFQFVLDNFNPCDVVHYKDIEVFRALENCPKEPDTEECEECNGRGSCDHCGQECQHCEGYGEVNDESKPEIHSRDKPHIIIGGFAFSPFYISKLEQVLLETSVESFSLIKKNPSGIMLKVGDLEIIFARLQSSTDDPKETIPEIHLKPIEK